MMNRRSSTFTVRVGVSILRDLNTDFSLHLADLLEKGDHLAFLKRCKDFNPSSWQYGPHDWRAFFKDYSASCLLKKYDNLDTRIETHKVALAAFVESENVCRETNIRLARAYHGGNCPPVLWSVIKLAQKKIRSLLGDFSWDEAHRFMDFGPGAAVGVTRKRRHSWYKIGHLRPTVTGECTALALACIQANRQWMKIHDPESSGMDPSECFTHVGGSRVTTVPKDASTDRCIAIEPLMNMFVQKGIGGVIRRRLRSCGVNLNSQQRNQDLAREGSITGKLATVDLSSASDSISRELVDLLLPDDWVLAMKQCRSHRSTLPSGEVLTLQKFSSMGNGYTFELESLIFWALGSACLSYLHESSRDFSVYGDDIIIPVSAVGLLKEVFAFVGFTFNDSKSYCEGPFRESCGKHFFLGHDVTPFYIRKNADQPERMLWLANGVRRLAHRMVGIGYGCDSSLLGSYRLITGKLPKKLVRLSIPEGFGDGGLVRDFDEARPRRHRCYDGYVVHHYVRKEKTFRVGEQPSLVLSLRGLDRRRAWNPVRPHLTGVVAQEPPEGDTLSINSERYVMLVVKSITPQWEGLGPWCSAF